MILPHPLQVEKAKFNTSNAYNLYRTGVKGHVDSKVYMKVIKDFFDELFILITIKNMQYNLPFDLGYIFLGKRKTNVRKRVDYGATNKWWATNPEAKEKKLKVYYTNTHTESWLYKYVYGKGTGKDTQLTTFKPVRTWNRSLAALLKNVNNRIDGYLW